MSLKEIQTGIELGYKLRDCSVLSSKNLNIYVIIK